MSLVVCVFEVDKAGMSLFRPRLVPCLVLAAALPALAGCVSPAERRFADEDRCRSYGFRPGSDAFGNCLQNIDLDRSADRRQLVGPYGGVGFGYGYGPAGYRRGGWW